MKTLEINTLPVRSGHLAHPHHDCRDGLRNWIAQVRILWLLLLLGISANALANQTITPANGLNYVTCQIMPQGGTAGNINNPTFLQVPASMSDVNGVGNEIGRAHV